MPLIECEVRHPEKGIHRIRVKETKKPAAIWTSEPVAQGPVGFEIEIRPLSAGGNPLPGKGISLLREGDEVSINVWKKYLTAAPEGFGYSGVLTESEGGRITPLGGLPEEAIKRHVLEVLDELVGLKSKELPQHVLETIEKLYSLPVKIGVVAGSE